MKLRAYFLFYVLSFVLSGCGIVVERDFDQVSSYSYGQKDSPQLKLVRLTDVYGTQRVVKPMSSVDVGPIRLNRVLNNGRFELEWQVDNSELYTIELAIGPQNDIRSASVFFGKSCNKTNHYCGTSAVEKCQLSPSLLLYCGKQDLNSPSFYAADISHFETNRLYLFVSACKPNRTTCDIRSIEVFTE